MGGGIREDVPSGLLIVERGVTALISSFSKSPDSQLHFPLTLELTADVLRVLLPPWKRAESAAVGVGGAGGFPASLARPQAALWKSSWLKVGVELLSTVSTGAHFCFIFLSFTASVSGDDAPSDPCSLVP